QMNETGFASPTPGREDARGYRPDREHEGQFLAADDAPGVNGSGGIVTSLADLARFEADFRAQARVWTPEIIALMLTPGRLNDGAVATMPEFGTAYGMGLSLVEIRDDVLISHDGGVEGFRAEYVRFARAQDSVVVMCNRADTDAAEIARELLRSAHAGPIEAEAQATSAAPNAAPPPEPASAALLSDIAGVYSAPELGARYEFRPIDGGFDVTITSPLQAAPVEDTWGGMRVTADGDLRTGPIRITPVRAHGVVVGLSLAFGRRVEGLALERVR
ncbi:MAG TPA: serine hydrolase, partial [Verrucomicrobiae bacterium]|nr:serine hydrolase [Verrucomicrobiae bacterium]